MSCIKESTGDLSRITAIRLATKDAITLIAGWESTSLQAFMAGATGWAPVCTNFVPRAAMTFFEAAVRKRDGVAAGAIWDRLFPLCEFICAKSHIRVAHTGLDIVGRPVGPPRRPMRMLASADRRRAGRAAAAGCRARFASGGAGGGQRRRLTPRRVAMALMTGGQS